MRRKNRDLKTLLYVISHDLREPLRAIQNFSQLVIERYHDRFDEKGADFIRRIARGADRLDEFLDDIVLLAKAQQIDALREVDGERVVEEALARLEVVIRKREVTIHVERPLPVFLADPPWAVQAVFNLIANAIKFTPPTLADASVEIATWSAAESLDEVGLVIRDRGPGVDARHAERIFELFQRAVGQEVEGTGAGLAIVRQIAERHGGRCWFKPRPGGGSEFIITFRTASPAEARPAAFKVNCAIAGEKIRPPPCGRPR